MKSQSRDPAAPSKNDNKDDDIHIQVVDVNLGALNEFVVVSFQTKIISCSSSSESSNTSSKLTTFKEAPKIASTDKTFEHYTRSPYKTPGPRRYGHVIKYKTDGLY